MFMRQRYTLTLGTGQLFRIIFFRRPAKKKVRPDGHREYFVEKSLLPDLGFLRIIPKFAD
ncbi:hypothetical protein HMPREF9720_2743 [Alistipes sp. HGB5]|nr:hypothetical protein HMPREF9720_2743 [Alistipes sp. HGB5]